MSVLLLYGAKVSCCYWVSSCYFARCCCLLMVFLLPLGVIVACCFSAKLVLSHARIASCYWCCRCMRLWCEFVVVACCFYVCIVFLLPVLVVAHVAAITTMLSVVCFLSSLTREFSLLLLPLGGTQCDAANANSMMSALDEFSKDTSSIVGAKFGQYTVEDVVQFRYQDPVDGSVAEKQVNPPLLHPIHPSFLRSVKMGVFLLDVCCFVLEGRVLLCICAAFRVIFFLGWLSLICVFSNMLKHMCCC